MNARDYRQALALLDEAEAHFQRALAEARGLLEHRGAELVDRLDRARKRKQPASVRAKVLTTWSSLEVDGAEPRSLAAKVAKRCRCTPAYARQIVREHLASI